jgi:hypothetical protein
LREMGALQPLIAGSTVCWLSIAVTGHSQSTLDFGRTLGLAKRGGPAGAATLRRATTR